MYVKGNEYTSNRPAFVYEMEDKLRHMIGTLYYSGSLHESQTLFFKVYRCPFSLIAVVGIVSAAAAAGL